MMKKFLTMAFAMVMAVGAFAADEIKFAWNGMSEATINAILADTNKGNEWRKLPAAFDLASQKDPTLYQNYDKFTAKIAELEKTYPDQTGFAVEQIVLCSQNKFSDEIFQKMYLGGTGKSGNKGVYVDFWYAYNAWDKVVGLTTPEVLLEKSFNIVKQTKEYERFFEILSSRQFELKDDTLKTYLKKLNRLVYPQIGTNDNMKQLAVKIQLMLKSLE